MATDLATSLRDAQRRQRRKELDAKRSKCRVRLGSSQQSWVQLKDSLGFSLHSELAHYLLDSYFSKVCARCSGSAKGDTVVTSSKSLHALVLLVHRHGQQCHFPPSPLLDTASQRQTPGPQKLAKEQGVKKRRCPKLVVPYTGVVESAFPEEGVSTAQEETGASSCVLEAELSVRFVCEKGHVLSWHPSNGSSGKDQVQDSVSGGNVKSSTPSAPNRSGGQGKRGVREMPQNRGDQEDAGLALRPRRRAKAGAVVNQVGTEKQSRKLLDLTTTKSGSEQQMEEDPWSDTERQPDDNESADVAHRGRDNENPENEKIPEEVAMPSPKRWIQTDDVIQLVCRKKRKMTAKAILPCKYEGCGQIFSSRQYLNHHVKYKHLHQRTFCCSQPSCGKSFNFKKHLKEHEKLHSNQRDFICDRCGGAFRTNSQLLVHYRIHTGEKPLQCEVCGFACNQKASLNWHMRKHNAEGSYQFPCQFCGRRFEKRYNLTTHQRRSHLDQTLSLANPHTNNTDTCLGKTPPDIGPSFPSDTLVKSEQTLP